MSMEKKSSDGIGWLGKSLIMLDEVDSTNDYLKREAAGLPHGAAVIAERQSAGKGRSGRGWHSGGLMMSFLMHGVAPEKLSALPLAVGLAVAGALEKLSGTPGFCLKWSNDVLFGTQKLVGILCEGTISADRAYAVAGVGVNVEQTREELDCLGLVYASSLKTATDKSYGILPVARAIFNEFEPIYEIYMREGFSALRERYKRRCITLGREIRVITGETERRGVAADIAGDGGLILEDGGIIRAGEASVRGLYGYA